MCPVKGICSFVAKTAIRVNVSGIPFLIALFDEYMHNGEKNMYDWNHWK